MEILRDKGLCELVDCLAQKCLGLTKCHLLFGHADKHQWHHGRLEVGWWSGGRPACVYVRGREMIEREWGREGGEENHTSNSGAGSGAPLVSCGISPSFPLVVGASIVMVFWPFYKHLQWKISKREGEEEGKEEGEGEGEGHEEEHQNNKQTNKI